MGCSDRMECTGVREDDNNTLVGGLASLEISSYLRLRMSTSRMLLTHVGYIIIKNNDVTRSYEVGALQYTTGNNLPPKSPKDRKFLKLAS